MGLGKAETRVDDDLLGGDPGGGELIQALGELGLDSGEDAVGVAGEAVHRVRVAPPVLADVDDAGLGDDAVHERVRQAPGDVVDDDGARLDDGPGGGGVEGVDADGGARCRQLAHDVEHAGLLLLGAQPHGARAGGLAADVENVCALLDELQAVGDGRLGRGPAAAVGEGVGGDVDDAHDERAAATGRLVQGLRQRSRSDDVSAHGHSLSARSRRRAVPGASYEGRRWPARSRPSVDSLR